MIQLYLKYQKHVTYYNHSIIDKYPPDKEKYPEFHKAIFYTVELKQGDSIFIPAGWWHWVFSKDNCIAFSHIIHNFNEEDVKEKTKIVVIKKKKIKYYSNINTINNVDLNNHSIESIPFVYNDTNINLLEESYLKNILDKINLFVSKTNTIVSVNKPENTTTTIINGNYKFFDILNNSDYYCYIGMSPLDKDKFQQFINTKWTEFAKKY